jgi:hypothetical protein
MPLSSTRAAANSAVLVRSGPSRGQQGARLSLAHPVFHTIYPIHQIYYTIRGARALRAVCAVLRALGNTLAATCQCDRVRAGSQRRKLLDKVCRSCSWPENGAGPYHLLLNFKVSPRARRIAGCVLRGGVRAQTGVGGRRRRRVLARLRQRGRGADLGSGRSVASEIEAPNADTSAHLV